MTDSSTNQWREEDSQYFIDYGRYFVPDRPAQLQTICDLIPPRFEPFQVLELCCGEGLLAEAILRQYASATVRGLDGSPAMLARAQERLAAFDGRFHPQRFDLAAHDWRTAAANCHAVVSSLAIHHLDAAEKRQLFTDVYAMLAPGGVFIVADVIQPVGQFGTAVAAGAWDTAVRQQALALDGNLDAYDAFVQKEWNLFRFPDPMDKPSPLLDQLLWLQEAGFTAVDAHWLYAGHAIFSGRRA